MPGQFSSPHISGGALKSHYLFNSSYKLTFPPTTISAFFSVVVVLLPSYSKDLIRMSLSYRNFWPPSPYLLALSASHSGVHLAPEHVKLISISGPLQLLLLPLEYSSSTMSCGCRFIITQVSVIWYLFTIGFPSYSSPLGHTLPHYRLFFTFYIPSSNQMILNIRTLPV